MEFYLSFEQLLSRGPNSVVLIFLPLFLIMTALEASIILHRQGTYPWKNAGVSVLVTVGHLVGQAATHGLIFGIIAAFVYKFRLTTIPVSFHNWVSLVVLFLLVDLGFYVEHRCSHRIRLLWASHSVHHSSEKMQATTAFRLSWTPILSGVFLFYLPIVWMGYDPIWVYGMVSISLSYQFFSSYRTCPARRLAGMGHQHAVGASGASREQSGISR